MSDPFRKLDLIRAALQATGASPADISTILTSIKHTAKSPEDFQRWNKILGDKEIQLLTRILSPGGDKLAAAVLSAMAAAITTHFGTDPGALKWSPDLN